MIQLDIKKSIVDMIQLEFCFSNPPDFYHCDCSKCRANQLFSDKLSKKLTEKHENSDVYRAVQKQKTLMLVRKIKLI